MKNLSCPMNHADLPASPGVYALIANRECIYVGSSVNLQNRIQGHYHRKKADSVYWQPCPEGELESQERHWAELLKPLLNRIPIKRGRPRLRAWYWSKRTQSWRQLAPYAVATMKRYSNSVCVISEKYRVGYHHPNSDPNRPAFTMDPESQDRYQKLIDEQIENARLLYGSDEAA